MSAAAEPATETTPQYSERYVRYALGLCFVVYTVNFIDRQILAILLQPIKEELSLTDTQLGLLSGTAFGLFYATLGVPIGRLADRHSRRGVMAVCIGLWSLMTALCGTARSFGMLLLYRVGVGVGEAGGSPPAISLISDYVEPTKRATALAIFSMGIPAGILIGYLVGGILREAFDWRVAFFVVGLPGLLVAILVRFTLREPPREVREVPPIRRVFGFLWNRRSFRHLSFAGGLYAFAGYSFAFLLPSVLERTHGMTPAKIGLASALIIGVGGGIATLWGGRVCDRWALSNRRAYVLVPTLAMAVSAPIAVAAWSVSDLTWALVLLTGVGLLGQAYQAPVLAASQSLAPAAMRVTTAAVLYFVLNIIGLMFGPVTTGIVSDSLAPRFGADSLRYALAIVSGVMYTWSALHFWIASRHIEDDFDHVREIDARGGLDAVAP